MEISEMEYELLQIFAAHAGRGSELEKVANGFKRIDNAKRDEVRHG